MYSSKEYLPELVDYESITFTFSREENGENVDYITVPFADEEDYKNLVIPKYIECGAIPKSKLIIGKTYLGSCRNASGAVWEGDYFVYQRYKFGYTFPEKINHFEDDNGYDLFVPIKLKEE